jgi:hypothetical protein
LPTTARRSNQIVLSRRSLNRDASQAPNTHLSSCLQRLPTSRLSCMIPSPTEHGGRRTPASLILRLPAVRSVQFTPQSRLLPIFRNPDAVRSSRLPP